MDTPAWMYVPLQMPQRRSLLRGEALRLPLRWLSVRELGRAEVVCRQWREEIVETASVWKEAAVNTNKIAVEAVLASSIGDGLRREGSPFAFNFRHLAAGLVHQHPQKEPPSFPEPKLRPEDFFYVIEIGRDDCGRSETVAAHCCADCSSWFETTVAGPQNLSQPFYSMSCANRYLDGPLAMGADMEDMYNSHSARLTLFRKDDGRSICLVQGAEVNELMYDDCNLKCELYFASYENGDPTPACFAENASGDLARRVMRTRKMEDMCFDVVCDFQPSNIPPGHGWVQKFDNGSMSQLRFSDREKEDLSCLSHLRFEMTSLTVGPCCAIGEECCNSGFDHPQDLLLILEGLDWK